MEYEIREDRNGKYWYLNGELHREDGPAIECYNGSRYWYKNGKRHREDGPAAEIFNGHKEWYKNGKLHREGGLPAVINSDGASFWFLNGVRYSREDYWNKIVCNRCGEILKSIKAINEIIHYCPKCQR